MRLGIDIELEVKIDRARIEEPAWATRWTA
jgi:hypothetical protein